MISKLPWELKFDGCVDRRMIKDDERRDVNCYYRENAEFIVTACNSYEANQAQITHLQAQLEKCREVLLMTKKALDNERLKPVDVESAMDTWIHKQQINEALDVMEGGE